MKRYFSIGDNSGHHGALTIWCVSHSAGDGDDPGGRSCDSPRDSSRSDAAFQPIYPLPARSGDHTEPGWSSCRGRRGQAIVAAARSRFSSGNGWSVGMDVFCLCPYAAQLRTHPRAFNGDFFFFVYGIPILLAICSRDTGAGLRTFVWLDGAQAFIAAMLGYLLHFSVLPSHARPRPIPASTPNYLTDADACIARSHAVVLGKPPAQTGGASQSETRDWPLS
jgi:hypothetical protein